MNKEIKKAIDFFNEGRVLEAREILYVNFLQSKKSYEVWFLKGLIESSQNNYNGDRASRWHTGGGKLCSY